MASVSLYLVIAVIVALLIGVDTEPQNGASIEANKSTTLPDNKISKGTQLSNKLNNWMFFVQRGFGFFATRFRELKQERNREEREQRKELIQRMETMEKNQIDMINNIAVLNASFIRLETTQQKGMKTKDDNMKNKKDSTADHDTISTKAPPVAHLPPCAEGWKHRFNKCYRFTECFHDCPLEKFQTDCEKDSDGPATLVSIHSKAENDFVISLAPANVMGIMIGARYNYRQNKWLWPDNSELEFTHWNHGQPTHTRNPCVYLYTQERGWVNIPCNVDYGGNMGHVCERPAAGNYG